MAPFTQRTLAKAAGVSQTTVSLSLRGDPSIPEATRKRIMRLANSMNYRPNPYVAGLMSHIRAHRRVKNGGCIALVVDAADEAAWFHDEIYRLQRDGMIRRAAELGFHAEPFFLQRGGMHVAALNRILLARGIRGVVFAGQKHRTFLLDKLNWPDFACATVSYTWDSPVLDRVCANHRCNMDTVIGRLHQRGYRRIGVSMLPVDASAVDYNWTSGSLVWNFRQRPSDRIPIFIGNHDERTFPRFARWLEHWKPDALVTKLGWERAWLEKAGLSVPGNIGLACFNRCVDSPVAGVEECHAVIGATVVEIVAAQILRNEYGLPLHPKLTLINGHWQEGPTVRPPTV